MPACHNGCCLLLELLLELWYLSWETKPVIQRYNILNGDFSAQALFTKGGAGSTAVRSTNGARVNVNADVNVPGGIRGDQPNSKITSPQTDQPLNEATKYVPMYPQTHGHTCERLAESTESRTPGVRCSVWCLLLRQRHRRSPGVLQFLDALLRHPAGASCSPGGLSYEIRRQTQGERRVWGGTRVWD